MSLSPALLLLAALWCAALASGPANLPAPGAAVTLSRHRRYLTYPDADPARVQFIIGVGLPVDLEDQSVTLGYVIKIQYHIPLNSTDYTNPMYTSASNARAYRNRRNNELEEYDPKDTSDNTRRGQSLPIQNGYTNDKSEINKNNKNDTADAEEFDKVQQYNNGSYQRHEESKYSSDSVYTEGGTMYRRREGTDQRDNTYLLEIEENEKRENIKKRPQTSRWDIYRILEHMIEQNGLSGKACVLRTICEAAETPFTYRNGLLGELFHIIFTPSTSSDVLSQHSDNQYHAAEALGTSEGSDCEALFPECQQSVLEMFSQVGLEAMLG